MPTSILERRTEEMSAEGILNDLERALRSKDRIKAMEDMRKRVSTAVYNGKIKSSDLVYLSSGSMKLLKKYNPKVRNDHAGMEMPFSTLKSESKYL